MTGSGRVRGYSHDGIRIFKGIPIRPGAPPAFIASCRRSRHNLGWACAAACISGQSVHSRCERAGRTTKSHSCSSGTTATRVEDCLRLNIWTPATGTGPKRPVMVWLHGGAFLTGSSQELRAYDGGSALPQWRCRCRIDQPSSWRVRTSRSVQCWRGTVCGIRQCGHVGHRREPGVGSRQHRGIRWRSGLRDDLRPIRWRTEGRDVDGDAVGQGACFTGRSPRVAPCFAPAQRKALHVSRRSF